MKFKKIKVKGLKELIKFYEYQIESLDFEYGYNDKYSDEDISEYQVLCTGYRNKIEVLKLAIDDLKHV